jgi:hypothetical protein
MPHLFPRNLGNCVSPSARLHASFVSVKVRSTEGISRVQVLDQERMFYLRRYMEEVNRFFARWQINIQRQTFVLRFAGGFSPLQMLDES